MIIILPAVVKAPVIPQLSPTVPSAEPASNIISDIEKPLPFSVMLNASVAVKSTTTKSIVMVIALPTTTIRIERLNISTCGLFLSAAMVVKIITASVTVFIPPAVEPGEPPTNISIRRINLLEADIEEMSTVLKPAVRAVID